MSELRILIAEDDTWYSEFLKYHLQLNPDFKVDVANNGKDLLSKMTSKPDVVTLDYSLPDMNGVDILQILKKDYPQTKVVVVSSQEDVNTAIDLLKGGAYDYIVKDDDTKDRLWNVVHNINENVELQEEVKVLRKEVGRKYDFANSLVGESSQIKELFPKLEKAANSNINVSVTGETGTGKEVVAKAIHFNSDKKKKPFVALNVAAIPKELIESELFGHEKGAFTGAHSMRKGKFEEAKDGTIFLDEIGEMDLNMQAKLLRVLQEKELSRVGGNSVIKIQCRIICATHCNLQDKVNDGSFRQDLFYRLIGLPISIAPLRDRKGDIEILANHFINVFIQENQVPEKKLSPGALQKLNMYRFPGNIRELKSIIDLAMILADGNEINATDINIQMTNPLSDLSSQNMTLREYNHKILEYHLEKNNQNVLKVAEILDIGKSTIYRMLKEEL